MSVSFNIDPVAIFDRISGRDKDRYNDSNSQRLADNTYRTQQSLKQDEWNWRNHRSSQTRIQSLVKDARAAGVSTLAALGAGGHSPANITVPAGQGGRVSGTYQRNSPATVSVQPDGVDMLQRQQAHETLRGQRIDNVNRQLDTNIKMLHWRQLSNPPSDYPPMYMRGRNNYEEAQGWVHEGDFPYLNPDMNMEMPESVGGYYFFKPRPEGWLNTLQD